MMTADEKAMIGLWEIRFKKWVWQYNFTDDLYVTWKDPLNGLGGKGRWARNGNFINVSWFDSSTKESFRIPIKPEQTGWYDAEYGKGSSKAKKLGNPESAKPAGIAVNPGIANVPWNKYVDQFSDVKYDMNYDIPKNVSFGYSTKLQLDYDGGEHIEIDLAEIKDDPLTSQEAIDALASGSLGKAGLIFPRIMTPRTVPRLWLAKQDALAKQNADADAFTAVAVAGVAWVLAVPAMPAGALPVAGVKVGSTRVPGVSRNAGTAISEVEMTAINAIRKNPEFAQLTVEEVAALRSYTGNNSKAINNFLRGAGGDAQAQAEGSALISGLKKLPGYSGKLTRIENMQLDEAAKMYQQGSVFRPQGMLSTSRAGAVSGIKGNVSITVNAIGKNGKDITNAAVFGTNAAKKMTESEVLFSPGTSFMIEKVENMFGALLVTLREL